MPIGPTWVSVVYSDKSWYVLGLPCRPCRCLIRFIPVVLTWKWRPSAKMNDLLPLFWPRGGAPVLRGTSCSRAGAYARAPVARCTFLLGSVLPWLREDRSARGPRNPCWRKHLVPCQVLHRLCLQLPILTQTSLLVHEPWTCSCGSSLL